MRTNVMRKVSKSYFYYHLCRRHHEERDACPKRKVYRADKLEPDVWELVSELMQDPQQVRDDLERMIERERDGQRVDPERESKAWFGRFSY